MKISKKILLVLVLLIVLVSTSSLGATNKFDEQFMFPYNKGLSLASEVSLVLSMAAPSALLFSAPSTTWVQLGVGYGTSMLASYATSSTMKHFIPRERPYQIPGNNTLLPQNLSGLDGSFPSRHTMLAFSAAAFTHAEYALYYPESPYRTAVVATTWALAASTAVLRVVSGNHFVTDVVTGAALGTLIGFAGPYMTKAIFKNKEGSPVLVVGPTVGLQVHL